MSFYTNQEVLLLHQCLLVSISSYILTSILVVIMYNVQSTKLFFALKTCLILLAIGLPFFLLYPAPHQPRLDWQMWFAALGGYHNNPWLVNLVYKLLIGEKEGM